MASTEPRGALTVPVVDRERCDARAARVEVCPCGAFEVGRLEPGDRAALSSRGKLGAWTRGRRQAYLARPGPRMACAPSVSASPVSAGPEGAPRVVRAGA